jgi:RimJ/RimL family protein N-acetyltransferase
MHLDSEVFRSTHLAYLRLVTRDDAEFICELRSSAELSRHLSQGNFGVEAQRVWLDEYKRREENGLEYYFCIMHRSAPKGVVRLYDFRKVDGRQSFCWGSWIIQPPRPEGLVTFSAYMVYEVGFDVLNFEQSHFDVRIANEGVNKFHLRAGAERVGVDEVNNYYVFDKSKWEEFRVANQGKVHLFRPDLGNGA